MRNGKDFFICGLFLAASTWGCSLCWDMYKGLREQSGSSGYADFTLSVQACLAMIVVQSIFNRIFAPIARMLIQKKARWSHAVWGAKIHRCSESVFKVLYYIMMTSWTYRLLREKPWLPSVLGGSGHTRNCWTGSLTSQSVTEDIQTLYLVAAGFHLSEVVLHVAGPKHPDFWEMLLHHTLTCFLVSFSYVLNYTRIGSLVMLLHGATDIFIYFSKAVVDTANVRLIIVSYVSLVAAYAWFRIYVFPAYVMRSAWIESLGQNGRQLAGWGFLNFALCILLLLHMYWFGLIIRIGASFRRTGEARDMQANLSKMDLQDKKKI